MIAGMGDARSEDADGEPEPSGGDVGVGDHWSQQEEQHVARQVLQWMAVSRHDACEKDLHRTGNARVLSE